MTACDTSAGVSAAVSTRSGTVAAPPPTNGLPGLAARSAMRLLRTTRPTCCSACSRTTATVSARRSTGRTQLSVSTSGAPAATNSIAGFADWKARAPPLRTGPGPAPDPAL
ncbi:hypothetical protein [Novosphingobium sp.]|uniref:hypothetical protein n=1 Tax=Novosphingobium sp. TaxID=1874826 RepID=UPI0026169807|nr:hypothetical protein [Novosphingobium sp.]